MAQLELFTSNGVISGLTSRLPLVGDGPTLQEPFTLDEARWYPNDGSPPRSVGRATIEPDDILVVVLPEPDVKVHAVWYPITLELGPYRVSGRLETQPGFDPDRALTRPGGSFVPLWDARIELLELARAGTAERAYVQVNRYAVEQVTSPLTLGFYFPGASFVEAEGVPVG
ncbi:MAG: hypothetical protein FIA92_14215 [Chloroflexi bacterium]|nr:hypothetical protein [Chloroflexota bacterium]